MTAAQSSKRIVACVNRGDWACAYGREDELERACSELAQRVPDARDDADYVLDALAVDMTLASVAWSRLALRFRR